jgi:hypothetical protein
MGDTKDLEPGSDRPIQPALVDESDLQRLVALHERPSTAVREVDRREEQFLTPLMPDEREVQMLIGAREARPMGRTAPLITDEQELRSVLGAQEARQLAGVAPLSPNEHELRFALATQEAREAGPIRPQEPGEEELRRLLGPS